MSEGKSPIELRYGYNQNYDEMDVLHNRTVPLRGLGLFILLCAIAGITYNGVNAVKSHKAATKVTAPMSHSRPYACPVDYSNINQGR